MKFGKEFKTHLEQTLPEWRDKFLRYKRLKKLVKQISATEGGGGGGIVLEDQSSSDAGVVAAADVGICTAAAGAGGSYGLPVVNNEDFRVYYPSGVFTGRGEQYDNRPSLHLEKWFVRLLDVELEKFNDFYVDKEEEFVIRLQELKERIERVRETSSRRGIFSSESKFSEEMVDIRKEFVKIHGEMVLLKNYSSLNFAGLVKILKKYDKRTGALLRLPFMQCALRQPFFTTEPLTRLVRECEANLELLFPLEAEVIESNAPNVTENKTLETVSSVREKDTGDMRRSILAAKRAIEGLRRASSTYNPLSLGYFFQGQDDDEAGAVTSVNSVSNEECDAKDVLSSK